MKNRPTDVKRECFSLTYTHTLQRRMCTSLRCKAAHKKRPICIKRDLYTYIYEKRVFLPLTHTCTHTRQRRMCTSLRCKAAYKKRPTCIKKDLYTYIYEKKVFLPLTHTCTHTRQRRMCTSLRCKAAVGCSCGWITQVQHCRTLQQLPTHTATHCNTLQHTATRCNTLCNTLQLTATQGSGWLQLWLDNTGATLQDTSTNANTHCNTLQHTATYCNTLQHKAVVGCSCGWTAHAQILKSLLASNRLPHTTLLIYAIGLTTMSNTTNVPYYSTNI